MIHILDFLFWTCLGDPKQQALRHFLQGIRIDQIYNIFLKCLQFYIGWGRPKQKTVALKRSSAHTDAGVANLLSK